MGRSPTAGLALAAMLAALLGCSGLSREIAGFTGTEVQFGAAAIAPAGFPLLPPPGASPYAMVREDCGHIRTWHMVDNADPTVLIDGYAQQMQAAGLTVERRDQGNRHQAIGTWAGERWSAEVVPSGGRHRLLLEVIPPHQHL